MDVSIAEAKNRLPELIRAVEQGEEVVITRHGKPVAQIAPLHSATFQALPRLSAHSKTIDLGITSHAEISMILNPNSLTLLAIPLKLAAEPWQLVSRQVHNVRDCRMKPVATGDAHVGSKERNLISMTFWTGFTTTP